MKQAATIPYRLISLFFILTPLLIHYNMVPLHRIVGRLSFIVAPMVVLSIFL